MAPRSTKAKKVAEVEVSQNDVAKKGRGKAKNTKDDLDVKEIEKDVIFAKKSKQIKKNKKEIVINQEETNQVIEDSGVTRKGRKKKAQEPAPQEKSPKRFVKIVNEDENCDQIENNEQTEKIISFDIDENKIKKHVKDSTEISDDTELKQNIFRKKRNVNKINYKESSDENGHVEKAETRKAETQKIKSSKARAKKIAPISSKEDGENNEQNNVDENYVDAPPPKSKKRGQNKHTKERTPDLDQAQEEDNYSEHDEDKAPKSKAIKHKKNTKKEKIIEKESKVKANNESSVVKKGNGAMKIDNAKGDTKEDNNIEEEAHQKLTKRKNGKFEQALGSTEGNDNEPQDPGEPTTKRQRKGDNDKVTKNLPKAKAVTKNKATTDYENIDFSNVSKCSQGKDWNFKISNWNVDGIRAWISKGGLDFVKYEKPDILCLQEIKCSQNKLPEEAINLPGYHAYWLCGEKDGYAGVGIYTTKLAINVQYGLQDEELDREGRIITAEYEQFYLICTYVPNAGRKLVTLAKKLKWNEEFRKYVKNLDKTKPVIICGDLNVAHNEIDLKNPKTNRKNAGFTDEERSGMTDLLGDGFIDTFRHLNPNKIDAYTFWTYMMNSRAKNVGWRLDYFIISERLLPSLCDSIMRDEVYGSDHCPISLFLHLSTADKPKE